MTNDELNKLIERFEDEDDGISIEESHQMSFGLIELRAILESRASQFESTLKETMSERDILKDENTRFKKIIAKELNENDDFGSEFVIASILRRENETYKEKLKIATEALEEIGIGYSRTCYCCDGGEFKYDTAREALEKIKELQNENK